MISARKDQQLPGKTSDNIVEANVKKHKQDEASQHTDVSQPSIAKEEEKPVASPKSFSVKSLHADVLQQRQKTLMNRVNFAWKVLQENQAEATDTATEQSAGLVHWKGAGKK